METSVVQEIRSLKYREWIYVETSPLETNFGSGHRGGLRNCQEGFSAMKCAIFVQ